MHPLHRTCAIALFLAVAGASAARATTLKAFSVEEMAARSTLVVRGTVGKGTAQWRGRVIHTVTGVTMFTALTSLLSGRRVRPDTAMTGECTLRGRVLPVGGIKEKVLAAHRAGITRVILPKKNERDLDDVPATVKASMEFFFAEEMDTVIREALEAAPVVTRSRGDLDDVPLTAPPAATDTRLPREMA